MMKYSTQLVLAANILGLLSICASAPLAGEIPQAVKTQDRTLTSNVFSKHCLGPISNVVVLGRINSDRSIVEYTLVNKTALQIVSWELGHSDKLELKAPVFDMPQRFEGPPGWTGAEVNVEETEFVSINWELKDRKNPIPPSAQVAGFRIYISGEFPRKTLYGPGGTKIAPTPYDTLPFLVTFNDRTCGWGRVTPEK